MGQEPARATAVRQRLIDIVHGALLGPGADACAVVLADIWARSTCGAHQGWVARTAHEWEYYFATQAHEAIGRLRKVPRTWRATSRFGAALRERTCPPLFLGERVAGIHIPAAAGSGDAPGREADRSG
ncbi:hypothetical protein LNW72_01000 [Streptomyces sp. RKAG293]|nr:hypothetical protein [Streptomyces sp. RKAG293]